MPQTDSVLDANVKLKIRAAHVKCNETSCMHAPKILQRAGQDNEATKDRSVRTQLGNRL